MHRVISASTVGFLLLVTIAAARPAGVSAQTLASFREELEAAGLSVAIQNSKISYDATQRDATQLVIGRNGAEVTVEVIEYESQTLLQADWVAINGMGPSPLRNTQEFAGRELYWNHRSVLIVDFRAPNDVFLADLAGDIFLGRAAVVDSEMGIKPPSTGDGGLKQNFN